MGSREVQVGARDRAEGTGCGAGAAEATVHSGTSLAVEKYRGRWNISDQWGTLRSPTGELLQLSRRRGRRGQLLASAVSRAYESPHGHISSGYNSL